MTVRTVCIAIPSLQASLLKLRYRERVLALWAQVTHLKWALSAPQRRFLETQLSQGAFSGFELFAQVQRRISSSLALYGRDGHSEVTIAQRET